MKAIEPINLPPINVTIDDEEAQAKLVEIRRIHPEKNIKEEETNEKRSVPYTWDEAGMSEVFSEVYMKEARFCPQTKCWYAYNGKWWEKDDGSLIVSSKIKEFRNILMVYAKWVIPEGDELREPFMKFVEHRMGDRRWRDRLLRDIADGMSIDAEEFDNKPYLINCMNGTYDLEHKCFRGHDPGDLLTLHTNFYYNVYPEDHEPRCEKFEEFIRQVTQEDEDKAKYLQQALGYSMLGVQKEECMFILHGKTTRNGKSTLLATVQHLMGDYADTVPVEMICKQERSKDPNAHTSQLAKLKGKRFVTMAESDTSSRLDESAVKQYTGGETITARELYQKPISFIPQFTMWMSCNDLPSVRDKSIFASERINVIEFNKHFTQEEQDKDLKRKFEDPEAMKGIFTWLLDGYYMYLWKKLKKPASVRAAVREYERDNDLILQFLEEKCEHVDDPGVSIPAKDLYERYKIWCKTNGYFVCTVKKFNAEVTAHPDWYTDKYKSMGMLKFRGLRLKSKLEERDAERG